VAAAVKAPDEESDERGLVQAAQRDPARFAELYERHFERVYAYVVRRVHDRFAAEDLTADVFQQALANIKRFEWRGAPFAAWLFRIAANAIADRWQREARERGARQPDPVVEPSLERVDEQARLFGMVARLPDDQRRVVHLRFVEQKSIREIAAELGRSEGAVKQLQFRAIESLRARMSQSHG
jgi:RNA polymerase sigma-70 factor (ECF subfamily)